MSGFRFLTTIIQREDWEDYINFYRNQGIFFQSGNLCFGTAQQKTLDYLGIEKTEKTMLHTIVPADNVRKLMKKLVSKMGIDLPGNGIAFTIPLGSVGGLSSMKYLTVGQEIIIEGEKTMNEMPYALIITIADKGNVEVIMAAARKANAAGGTVVHAKSTESELISKFFGVSIADEKDMIYILAKKTDKDNIMKAIMKEAGIHTKSHAAVFSLPVEDVVGLRRLTEEE